MDSLDLASCSGVLGVVLCNGGFWGAVREASYPESVDCSKCVGSG